MNNRQNVLLMSVDATVAMTGPQASSLMQMSPINESNNGSNTYNVTGLV